jgi:hypothetical protein
MTQLCLDMTPREIGLAAAKRCLDAAERSGFDAEGARRFIASWVRRHGPTSGEDLTDAAKAHGFRGKDDRCFGGVFLAAVSRGELVVLRSDLPRRRGHGTTGGKLYAAGVL